MAGNRFIRAFFVSAAGTGLSRVLGAVRDIAIAGVLGATASSDAFWIAFTVPNVFRRFVADEGLTGALVPALAVAEAEEGEEAGRHLADALLGVLLVANLALIVAGMVFAEELVLAFAWKYRDDPEQLALTTSLARWLIPFVGCVSLVSFAEGLLNHRGHYFVPKAAPGVVSAFMAGSLWLLGSSMSQPVYALVVGVLVGGVAHVLVHVPVLARHWGRVRVRWDLKSPRVRGVLWQLGIVVAIGVFAQFNIIVLRQLSAALGPGEVTRYWFANRVVDLSQGIVAVAIGSALLPPISRAVAAGDFDALESALVRALSLAGFLLLPAATVLWAFGVPMVAMLFGHGAFSEADVLATAAALRMLVPFLLAVAGINILKRVFFALDDRMPLFYIGGLGVSLTAALGWTFSGTYGLPGLTLALSVATIVQLMAYIFLLRRRIGAHLGGVRVAVRWARMSLATLPGLGWMTWVAGRATWLDNPLAWSNLGWFAAGFGGAAVSYAALTWLLGVEELTTVVDRLRARFGR
jgi:putative peptidoglycan lipid II flippase